MSVSIPLAGLTAVCILFTALPASAGELSRYREFTLGSSLATVSAVTRTSDRDLKTIHSRPALLQDVVWQPRYTFGAPVADRESINEVVFSFIDDQLFRIAVVYDRGRTTGLTNADMIAALTELYGAPSTLSDRSQASADSVDGVDVLAEWQQSDAHVALRRSRYTESFSLVITSVPLEVLATTARATALVIDAREAPAREAELAKKRVDKQREAEEQARRSNKKVFKP
jgi:hypothetical protein